LDFIEKQKELFSNKELRTYLEEKTESPDGNSEHKKLVNTSLKQLIVCLDLSDCS
jgi:hypothetical protein